MSRNEDVWSSKADLTKVIGILARKGYSAEQIARMTGLPKGNVRAELKALESSRKTG